MIRKKFLLIFMSVLSLFFCENMSVSAAAPEEKLVRGVATKTQIAAIEVPNFIPLASDTDRKSILIIGAHPNDSRWKSFYPQLAEKYDLTFVTKESLETSELEGFKTEPLPILFDAQMFSSPDRRVKIWKFDFNEFRCTRRALALRDNGNVFDLIINDYSVYKFFTDDAITMFVQLLKPTGYCVLGPLSTRGDEIQVLGSAKDILSLNTGFLDLPTFSLKDHRQTKLSWNIGCTEADKKKIVGFISEKKKLSDSEREQLSNFFSKISTANAEESLKQHFLDRFRAFKAVKLTPVKATDIQRQLDQILPKNTEVWFSDYPNWVVISPKPMGPTTRTGELRKRPDSETEEGQSATKKPRSDQQDEEEGNKSENGS